MRTTRTVPHAGFIALCLSLIAVLFAFPTPAEPNVAGDLRTGYHADTENGLIGGGINTDLSASWDFNPNLEWVLVDGYDLWSVNADFHRDFGSTGPALWLGAGPALLVTELDPDGPTDKDLGLNLLGGIGAREGAVRPFAQMKVTVADNAASTLALGLRF
jgi:hypothetical protein